MTNTYIKEIFESIQGEALHIGEKQIFIRFCGCNLNCNYCDTDFSQNNNIRVNDTKKVYTNPINALALKEIVNSFRAETISLTGGEPLLQADFLSEFLPILNNKKIYLETNGTLPFELKKIIKYIDIISMDIKLECSTGEKNTFKKNSDFIKVSTDANKEIFVKIVLDKNYSKTEITNAIEIIKPFNIPLIIQPMDCKNKINELDKKSIIELFNFITSVYKNCRLIPQVHKFLGLS